MHRRACFWKPSDSERVNESQKLLTSAEKYFYPTFSSFPARLSHRKLFFIRSETLGLLVNTLTANDGESRINIENLPLRIEIKVYKKPSTFCCICLAFFECTLNFQCSEKNNEPPRSSISEVVDSKIWIDLNV